ncbi:hypothetical protein MBEHAL_2609 [Halarchaeum acidiphilum MH1-52-1]|uniref:Uncharacterized protein n=1 Tax=Halarchaeum acidiphilum MH1-52-1 TaxID=1261545 RepID=U3A870_9EURY|nr:hypothetical protein [Halarchaeum acidiphilum]GAD53849.1 hypothetical protein MBEHAL_2609 [Halarchaeum acidiphilum MH1-52-1]
MSEDARDHDFDELRALVADLDEAAAALRAYGEANDIPAIERNAKRVQGTVGTVKQNVPGGIARDGRERAGDGMEGSEEP